MKREKMFSGAVCTLLMAGIACEPLDDALPPPESSGESPGIMLEEVAQLLSWVDIRPAQMTEVLSAVDMSAGNGYDEEYTMQALFSSPGSGVGGSESDTKAPFPGTPLRDLLRQAAEIRFATRSGVGNADAWLDSLSMSDIQIYWPYSRDWDGLTTPVITFDPGDGAVQNVGFLRRVDGTVESVLVTEELARSRPVWVVNRNDDAEYRTLELLRREDPSWGEGGGDILVRPSAVEKDVKTLVLRSFQANRQFDSWFAGASEFFVKVGAVEDFTASTEAELRLYEPSITDFMIVIRRGQVGEQLPFNAVLVSEWTGQLSSCALMIIEDDGGSRTSWKCSTMVKYNSKSYGFDIEIPLYTRDDIVWRGTLTKTYIEKYSGVTGHFGDVDLVLELI